MYECETCGMAVKVKIVGDYILNTYYCDDCSGWGEEDAYMGSDSDFSDHALGIDY